MRSKIAERERRRELKQRESLRRQVVQMVIDEMAQQERPREIAIQLEQQKKSLAAIGAAHADDRYALQRSSLYRRFYEPTREEREQREENWHRRRSEHRLQRDARLAQIQVCVCALSRGSAPLLYPRVAFSHAFTLVLSPSLSHTTHIHSHRGPIATAPSVHRPSRKHARTRSPRRAKGGSWKRRGDMGSGSRKSPRRLAPPRCGACPPHDLWASRPRPCTAASEAAPSFRVFPAYCTLTYPGVDVPPPAT